MTQNKSYAQGKLVLKRGNKKKKLSTHYQKLGNE